MQQIKFELPSRIHFLDCGPYHQNKALCPELVIDTQLTNITLNRLEVDQSIPRCDYYWKLYALCVLYAHKGNDYNWNCLIHNSSS